MKRHRKSRRLSAEQVARRKAANAARAATMKARAAKVERRESEAAVVRSYLDSLRREPGEQIPLSLLQTLAPYSREARLALSLFARLAERAQNERSAIVATMRESNAHRPSARAAEPYRPSQRLSAPDYWERRTVVRGNRARRRMLAIGGYDRLAEAQGAVWTYRADGSAPVASSARLRETATVATSAADRQALADGTA